MLRIADRITVLRDGRVVARRRPAETDQDALVRDMVGRELAGWSRRKAVRAGPVLLEARGLSRDGEFRDVNLTIRAGEIVGIAGLMGSFRGPLGRTLCGVLAPALGRDPAARQAGALERALRMPFESASPTCRRTGRPTASSRTCL